MHADFDLTAADRYSCFRLLTAIVVPRPIAWVSTLSADGADNLAPFSFFGIACVDPPVVQFSSIGRRDSLRNIEETGEFVVNVAPESLWEKVNATATEFPHGVSEFDEAGLEREPSTVVKPPRVAASPAALECELHSTVRLGDSTVVFGRVVHARVSVDVLEGNHPVADRMRPMTRMGRNEWATLGEVRELAQVPYSG